MKITFVVPKEDDRQHPLSQYAQCKILPPAGLARMAGLAGNHGSVKITDERIDSVQHNWQTHITVIFINSYNSYRACALARLYRHRGSHVVFTGPKLAHPGNDTFHPERYADSLLLGSGEETLPALLADFVQGKTRRYYHESTFERGKQRNPFMVEDDYLDSDLEWAS
jgi:hypothetical protein